jgi:hypothetical protein
MAMTQISFDEIFKSANPNRDKFLSRLFGIFSEDIVRKWCADSRAPYRDLGRPTVRLRSERRGRTLDFTFQSKQDGLVFVGELKCELEFENYRYLRLTSSSQLDHHKGEAFAKFRDIAKNAHKYIVTVDGKGISVAGSILVWGSVATDSRSVLMRENGFADILSLEDIIVDLLDWGNEEYRGLIEDRADWCRYLFNKLVARS